MRRDGPWPDQTTLPWPPTLSYGVAPSPSTLLCHCRHRCFRASVHAAHYLHLQQQGLCNLLFSSFGQTLVQLRNKKKRLYRNAERLRTTSPWEKYKQCLDAYCSAICSAEFKYFSKDLGSHLKTNPKKFWCEISPSQDNSHITLHDENNEPLTNTQCCSAFNTFFASVFTREDQSTIPYVPDYDYQYMQPI